MVGGEQGYYRLESVEKVSEMNLVVNKSNSGR